VGLVVRALLPVMLGVDRDDADVSVWSGARWANARRVPEFFGVSSDARHRSAGLRRRRAGHLSTADEDR
jgi:hypothetical protein